MVKETTVKGMNQEVTSGHIFRGFGYLPLGWAAVMLSIFSAAFVTINLPPPHLGNTLSSPESQDITPSRLSSGLWAIPQLLCGSISSTCNEVWHSAGLAYLLLKWSWYDYQIHFFFLDMKLECIYQPPLRSGVAMWLNFTQQKVSISGVHHF